MAKTFEELNGMTIVKLVAYAGEMQVPGFRKSWKKAEMIESICKHIDCERPKRGRSRSRSPSKSPKKGRSKSRSRSPSKNRKQKKEELKALTSLAALKAEAKKAGVTGLSTFKSGDKSDLIKKILKALGLGKEKKAEKKEDDDEEDEEEKPCPKENQERAGKDGRCVNKCKPGEKRDTDRKCKKTGKKSVSPPRSPPKEDQKKTSRKNKHAGESDSFFNKKKTAEIEEMLKKEGIYEDIPSLKKDRVSLYKADRCDPDNEQYCSDDEECQVPNRVCMPYNKAAHSKKGFEEFQIGNHKIVGKKATIDSLKAKMKSSPPSPQSPPSPPKKVSAYVVYNQGEPKELKRADFDFDEFIEFVRSEFNIDPAKKIRILDEKGEQVTDSNFGEITSFFVSDVESPAPAAPVNRKDVKPPQRSQSFEDDDELKELLSELTDGGNDANKLDEFQKELIKCLFKTSKK
jgi:hypothetical protein